MATSIVPMTMLSMFSRFLSVSTEYDVKVTSCNLIGFFACRVCMCVLHFTELVLETDASCQWLYLISEFRLIRIHLSLVLQKNS